MSNQNGSYQQTRWSLADIFTEPQGSEVKQTVEALEQTTSALEAMRPVLSPDISEANFARLLAHYERFTELAHRLGSYGQLWFSEDTQNQNALAMMGRMEQLLTEAQNRILFVSLWWKGLDDEAANRLLAYAGDMRYSLVQERLFKDYTLSEAEEKVINIKDINGVNALTTLYDMITNKFVFEIEVDGEVKKLTRGELMIYVRDPRPELRAAAYKELFRVFGQEASVLSQIYIHRVRDWANENVKLRGLASPLSVRNLSNDIPDPVVDTLLEVCVEQAPLFQRYFKLKANWLGLPKLRRYDLYAPLSTESSKKIAYDEAVTMVLDSFELFSPVIAGQAHRVFKENHIDSEVRAGKRSGAFCASILPNLTPWVLINYTGEPREVATLAHELGHAIHSMMAADHSVLTFHSALPLAETASVFSEMLLTDRLLAAEEDPLVRRSLLVEAVDDAYATVMRQAYFVLFERQAHQAIADGSTFEQLNQLYSQTLTLQFGDSIEISDDFRLEWVCIPHIYHTPFYCYAYSFGQLLSLSLYQRYQEQGDPFKPTLLKILAYGGSASPDEILKEAGIDMADPDFWGGGFRFIEGMIDELEKLASA
ncbi:MAG TPA: M3 family oligoendopeptidase [Anaerolineae bacterium]|nr:M3 family oligoendopeptidase [Anaerolineae bacterium]